MLRKFFFIKLQLLLIPCNFLVGQTHISADPYYLLQDEKKQFEGDLPAQNNIFRPIFFVTDSIAASITYRAETYLNDNNPNQENMDVRYFSKGFGVLYRLESKIFP